MIQFVQLTVEISDRGFTSPVWMQLSDVFRPPNKANLKVLKKQSTS
jgi:hypothetical protein